PLNGVIAGLDALRARTGGGEHRDVVDMVWASAATLAARIDDLFMAQPAAVERELASETIALPSLLDELTQPFVEAARAKNLDLIVAAPQDIPTNLIGDRNCLLSALRPLVDNAVKFTDAGKITIRLDHFRDGWLRFSILDTGVGFDPEAKDQLFASFGRQDQSLTRRFGGLGLGLASARAAAARMGGDIDAKPRAGGGSIFWMDLPLPSTAITRQGGATDQPPMPERLRILVADDHPTNRRVLELILGELADVTSVVNGQEAVEATQATRFDVVLMDIQMPVMDGITAVAAIRERERAKGMDPTPVIMLTANTEKEYVRASHAAGANRHIAKPFTASVLLEAISGVQARTPGAPLSVEIAGLQRRAS
ncbi:MAG: ATP-binding response regulator, partial [Brevundimonas sp.]